MAVYGSLFCKQHELFMSTSDDFLKVDCMARLQMASSIVYHLYVADMVYVADLSMSTMLESGVVVGCSSVSDFDAYC